MRASSFPAAPFEGRNREHGTWSPQTQAAAVVPVEETSFLVVVQRVVSAVQQDLLRRRGTGIKEQVDLTTVHRLLAGLLVPIRLGGHGRLKPVRGTRPVGGSGRASASLRSGCRSPRQQTVVPKVVVEILVTRRDSRRPTSRRTECSTRSWLL